MYSRHTLEKRQWSIEIVSILQIKKMRELFAQHLFLNARIDVDVESLTHNMRAIIDYDITYNFIN
jgi:hypothetical protein